MGKRAQYHCGVSAEHKLRDDYAQMRIRRRTFDRGAAFLFSADDFTETGMSRYPDRPEGG